MYRLALLDYLHPLGPFFGFVSTSSRYSSTNST
jgi:hypothetical protein